MNLFENHKTGPYDIWRFVPWKDVRINHGFIGITGDFSNTHRDEESKRFCKTFDVDRLILPTQVHGTTVVDLNNNMQVLSTAWEADAMIIPLRDTGVQKKAFGVRTADCVPLIIKSRDSIALIHAGWRGLAKGIIQEVIKQMNDSRMCEVLIGPCAGGDRYEVGGEVLDALGENGVYKQVGSEKFMLSLARSARKILQKTGITPEAIHTLEICTISDTRFHSYRRQGLAMGSNLTFGAFTD